MAYSELYLSQYFGMSISYDFFPIVFHYSKVVQAATDKIGSPKLQHWISRKCCHRFSSNFLSFEQSTHPPRLKIRSKNGENGLMSKIIHPPNVQAKIHLLCLFNILNWAVDTFLPIWYVKVSLLCWSDKPWITSHLKLLIISKIVHWIYMYV